MMEGATREPTKEATTRDPLEGLGPQVLARVRRSLVDVYVKRAKGGGELHTLGVVGERNGVIAWSGVDTAGAVWENLGSISIRQGSQEWRAEMHTLNADWILCGLAVRGDFPVPVIPWRRSNTLAMGARLLYAVADPQGGEPRLGWAQIIDVYTYKKSYDRQFIWTAQLDPAMPREYAFAFDGEGRVAGILEPLPECPGLAALLPGEFVGRLRELCWVRTLSEIAVGQLVEEYRRDPDSYEAESQCAVALALVKLGDNREAVRALRRAVAKDPRNPWSLNRLASLIMPDRIEEARALQQRARELQAEEPDDARERDESDPPGTTQPATPIT